MTASEVRALIVGLVLVCGVAIGAIFWRNQHPDDVEIARLATAMPPSKPSPRDLPSPQDMAKLEAPPSPAAPVAKAPDLGDVTQGSKPEPAAGSGEAPHFDVVRVEPSGDAVIAGKGDPNAKVELLASGKVIAEAKADASGHFVILPSTLAAGNYDLTLRQTPDGKAALDSMQSVAVSVPAKGGQVVVAIAEPGKATKLISGPPAPANPPEPMVAAKPPTDVAPPAAVAPAGSGLAIRSVELENGNGFFASGAATPGTRVQIYLNGSHLAEVVAGPDGQWSVKIRQGLTGGHYAVRADANGDGAKVTARVEVPFDVPVAMAQMPRPAALPQAPEPPNAPPREATVAPREPRQQVAVAPEADPASSGEALTPRPDLAAAARATVAAETPAVSAPAVSAPEATDATPDAPPSRANAIIDQIETALVIPGDNLWNISRSRLGFGHRFTQIYAANVSQIRDPRLIYPGQVFVVPTK